MKRIIIITGSLLATFLIIGAIFVGIGYDKFMTIETVEHDPQLEIVLGGGGNSIILTSEDGFRALVVDTKMGSAAKALRKKVRAAEIIIVNTHAHPDHTGGNALYGRAHVISSAYTIEQWHSMAGKISFPDETIPVGGEKVLHIGSETVHVRNIGRAHTWQDIVVYLEKRKLLITGDLLFLDMHPVLKAGDGCNTVSWTGALDTLLHDYDPVMVMPGHGPLTDKYALAGMKEYFTSIHNAINDRKELAFLRKKYTYYHSLPLMSGFDMTMKFMQEESMQKK